jgi:hypothetical protein
MSAGRAIFLTVLSAALVLLCLWPALQSNAPLIAAQNLPALGGVLFFTACALVGASSVSAAKVPAAEADGSTSIYNSPSRAMALALACVAFAVGAVMAQPILAHARNPIAHYIIYIIVPAGALGAAVCLQRVVSGEPAYKLDKHGITVYGWRQRTAAWTDITDVRSVVIRGAKSIGLWVTPRLLATLGGLAKVNSTLGFGALTLHSGATGVRTDALEGLVRDYWQRNRAA